MPFYVEEDGDPSVPLTGVFVPGFTAAWASFDLQRTAMRGRAAPGWVLWDQRGHGRSGWGDPRHATIEQTGRDLGCVPGSRSSRPPQMITGFGRHCCGCLLYTSDAADDLLCVD